MKKIVVEFEKGGKFTGELYEKEAPKNSKMIWDALPFEGQAWHGIWSGHGVLVKTPFNPAVENPLTIIQHGMIGFLPHIPGLPGTQEAELTFAMGYLRPRTPYTGDCPLYVVGRMNGTFEELREVSKRIQRQGMEKLWIKRGAETT